MDYSNTRRFKELFPPLGDYIENKKHGKIFDGTKLNFLYE